MGVMIARVPVFVGRVNGNVRNHPDANEMLADKAVQQLAAFVVGQLVGKRELNLARKLCVGSRLDLLDRVPKLLTIKHPVGCIVGCNDFGRNDTVAAAEIVDQSCSLVDQG